LKVAVIGGGAAGFFAAIHAAIGKSDVVVLEKSSKVLAKVKVSGGGRCNVTNGCTDNSILLKNYPRGYRELAGPFSRFSTGDTFRWFGDRGVKLKTESDGRVFPVSDNSQTIIDCLVTAANKSGVKVLTHHTVTGITKNENNFTVLVNGSSIEFDKIIITTGGSSKAEFYEFINKLGHKIIHPVPSLFTFNVFQNTFKELMGVSVSHVIIKIKDSKYESDGPLLFTHWGLSGPAVLKLSSEAAFLLHEKKYQFDVLVNFLPHSGEDEIRDIFENEIRGNPAKKIFNYRLDGIPARLWMKLCSMSGIQEEMKWGDISKKSKNRLISLLIASEIKIGGKTTFKEEFVTCGGVDLREVDMKTMESKVVPGLYFAGEVLNIDALTGGFNFQAAWTTGYLAGISASK